MTRSISAILTLFVTLLPMSEAMAAESSCYGTPGAYFLDGGSYQDLRVCEGESPYCQATASETCQIIETQRFLSKIKALKAKGLSLNEVQLGSLATYLSLMDWQGPILIKGALRWQTGPYAKLELSRQLPHCLPEIMESARLLSATFSETTFSIDGKIKNCRQLLRGVHTLVLHQKQVKRNLSRFMTPMHTVYLTNQSKFNHDEVGAMGLYIDVGREDEIRLRLIDFKISRAHISQERLDRRVGGKTRKIL